MSDPKPPSHTKPSMPAQPKTTQLPAMTDRALLEDLTRVVKEGFAASAANDTLITQEVRRAQSDIRGLRHDVVELQDWRQQVQGVVMPRLDTHSIKVQRISEHDADQDGKIADALMKASAFSAEVVGLKKDMAETKGQMTSLRATLDEVVAKVDTVHSTVVGVFRNPKVIFVGKVIFFAAVAYSGLHGLKVVP